MNTLTHDLRLASPTAKRVAPATPMKGFWARVFDAIVESRTRRVEDELCTCRHLVADILARRGFGTSCGSADKIRFAKQQPDQALSLPTSWNGSGRNPEMQR